MVQKFVLTRLQAIGRHTAVKTKHGRMTMQLTAEFRVGGSNPGRPTVVGGKHGGGAANDNRPTRIRTTDQILCGWLHYHSATAFPGDRFPPNCMDPSLPLTKIQTVRFFCLTDCCWHGQQTGLADCQPHFKVHCRRQKNYTASASHQGALPKAEELHHFTHGGAAGPGPCMRPPPAPPPPPPRVLKDSGAGSATNKCP